MNMNDSLAYLQSQAVKKSCLPRWALALLAAVLVLALASCTTTTLTIPTQLLQQQAACNAAKANVRTASFSDPRDQLLVEMGRALADATGKNGCDSAVNTYLQYESQLAQTWAGVWSKGVGAAGMIGGIWATGSAIEGILGAGSSGITATASGGSSISVNNVSATARDMAGGAGFGGVGWTATPPEPTVIQPTVVQPTIVEVPAP